MTSRITRSPTSTAVTAHRRGQYYSSSLVPLSRSACYSSILLEVVIMLIVGLAFLATTSTCFAGRGGPVVLLVEGGGFQLQQLVSVKSFHRRHDNYDVDIPRGGDSESSYDPLEQQQHQQGQHHQHQEYYGNAPQGGGSVSSNDGEVDDDLDSLFSGLPTLDDNDVNNDNDGGAGSGSVGGDLKSDDHVGVYDQVPPSSHQQNVVQHQHPPLNQPSSQYPQYQHYPEDGDRNNQDSGYARSHGQPFHYDQAQQIPPQQLHSQEERQYFQQQEHQSSSSPLPIEAYPPTVSSMYGQYPVSSNSYWTGSAQSSTATMTEIPPPPLPQGDNMFGVGGPTQRSHNFQYGQTNDDIDDFDDNGSPLNGDDSSDGLDLAQFDKEYIMKGLARIYRKKILPYELSSRYAQFHSSPPLSAADFEAPPLVLLVGQYSVGKTSFVKYLVGRDFPGMRVGPEPTTDRFNAVLWGPTDKVYPGAALATQKDRPFTGLQPYGNNFLTRLEGVEMDSPVLRNVTLVDSPGILSGEKQRSRNYDYESVMKWFGDRADLIIVMFDAHKLDISDELKRVMELFIPHQDKVRIVLNKADSVSTQQLMRVYGALMWQLGKVLGTPEVARVYMGSFWDAPLKNTEQAELLQREELDLLNEIMRLPEKAVMSRINELIKRARSVKVHTLLIHYLRKQLPKIWGTKEKQRKLINRLEQEFNAAASRYNLPKGDFPSIRQFRDVLLEIRDLSEIPKLDNRKKMEREMEKIFAEDIPELLEKARNQR